MTASAQSCLLGFLQHGPAADACSLRHTAVEEQPIPGSANMYNFYPVSVASLRRELFEMLESGDAHLTTLAEECLSNIDDIRDDFGIAESEPRHPDVASGRPWPCEASGITLLTRF